MRWKPITALALAIGAGAYLAWPRAPQVPGTPRHDARGPAHAPSAERAPASPSGAEPRPEAARASTPPIDDAARREYETFTALQSRLQAFFAAAPGLTPAERRERAVALAREVAEQESTGKIVAAESLQLRLALLKHSAANEPEYRAEAERLTRETSARAAERERAGLARIQADPRFVDYKQREAAIVREVMSMSDFPGGLSRDEYLRQRLDAARGEAYDLTRTPPR
jgi:hypothetical protein